MSTWKLLRVRSSGSSDGYVIAPTWPPSWSWSTIDLRMSLIWLVLNRSSVDALPRTVPACSKYPTPDEKSMTFVTGTLCAPEIANAANSPAIAIRNGVRMKTSSPVDANLNFTYGRLGHMRVEGDARGDATCTLRLEHSVARARPAGEPRSQATKTQRG